MGRAVGRELRFLRFCLQGIALVYAGLWSSAAVAESLQRCIERTRLQIADRSSHVVESAGCSTLPTHTRIRSGELLYFKKECDYSYCWKIPEDRRVVEVAILPIKREGAKASYWGPLYKPSQSAASEVCVRFYALSAAADGAVAEVKARIRVATVRRPTAEALRRIADSCIEQGAD